LKFGTTVGVTLAIVRKARVLVWTAIGVTLLVRRGLSVRSMTREAREATAAAVAAASTGTGQKHETTTGDERGGNSSDSGNVINEEELIAPR
jgi:hypothetical protein